MIIHDLIKKPGIEQTVSGFLFKFKLPETT